MNAYEPVVRRDLDTIGRASSVGGRLQKSLSFVGNLDGWQVSALTVVGLTAILILALLVIVLWTAWLTGLPGDPELNYTTANYAKVFSDREILLVLVNTFAFCFLSLFVALLFGLPAAWLVERTDLPGKRIVLVLMTVGLLIPGFASAMGWLLLLHPGLGIFNRLAKDLFELSEAPLSILNIFGMGWVQGLSLAPVAFVMTAAVFRAMDPALEEAAQTSRASWRGVMRHVTLPLAWPGILAASIYIFTIGFASFDVPAIIGWSSRILTFSTYLYMQVGGFTDLPNYGIAAALSTVVLVLAIAFSLWYSAMQRRAHRYSVITGKGYRPRILKLGNGRYGAWAYLGGYFLANIGMPVLLLGWASLLPIFQPPSLLALDLLSFKNFGLVPWELAIDALGNTGILMVLTPTIAIVVSIAFSWLVLRSRIPGRQAFDVLAFLPHAIPNIIFGMGALLITLYVVQQWVPLYGTVWILLVVFVVARISYGTRMTNSGFIQIHKELEESATTCRAPPWRVAWSITLPLLAPTIAYAWLWIALLSFRELTLAILVTTTGNVTLPVVIWSLWEGGSFGKASALTLVMFAIIVPLIVIYWMIARRRELAPA